LADAVPPEGIEEYRDAVREIRAQCAWSLLVPAGQDRPHQRSDFGRLPVLWEASSSLPHHPLKTLPARNSASPRPASLAQGHAGVSTPAGARESGPSAPAGRQPEIRYRRRKRHRRHHREHRRDVIWQAILGALLVVAILLLALSLFKKASGYLPAVKPPATELPNQ
jgi:hypothetical protein